MTPILCTGFAFRFGHRKWNRGRNRLPKLVQTNAPSVPFPVFKSEGEHGIVPWFLAICDLTYEAGSHIKLSADIIP